MKHTKTLQAAAGILTAVTLAVSATSAVEAHDNDEHEQEHDETTDSIGDEESVRNDALIIAKANGYRLSDAIEFAEDSRVFADITTAMSEKYLNTFAAAEYAEDPGEPALIRFKGSVPDEVKRQVGELGFEVIVDDTAKRSATRSDSSKRSLVSNSHRASSRARSVPERSEP